MKSRLPFTLVHTLGSINRFDIPDDRELDAVVRMMPHVRLSVIFAIVDRQIAETCA